MSESLPLPPKIKELPKLNKMNIGNWLQSLCLHPVFFFYA